MDTNFEKKDDDMKIEIDCNVEDDIGYGSDDKEETSGGKNELKRPDLKGSFRCSICSKVFCHSSSLSRHRMQAHFKSYKCTICGKDVSNSESLRSHMVKQHHISRTYMCRCCNWAFPDKSLLHMHLQSNNTSDTIRHSVINRSCHNIPDAYQLLRSPLLPNPITPITTLPVIDTSIFQNLVITPQTSAWLATLPKPVPTTTPIFVKKDEEDKGDQSYCSQSPACSSISFDSTLSAFHQLNTDRAGFGSPNDSISPSSSSSSESRISPRHATADCFHCQIHKTKLAMADNKCKYLESRTNTLQNEAVDTHAQLNTLEHTVQRMRIEQQVLRDHNELFQRKLLDCQRLTVRFLQSNKLSDASEVGQFLNHLVNSTIITT